MTLPFEWSPFVPMSISEPVLSFQLAAVQYLGYTELSFYLIFFFF